MNQELDDLVELLRRSSDSPQLLLFTVHNPILFDSVLDDLRRQANHSCHVNSETAVCSSLHKSVQELHFLSLLIIFVLHHEVFYTLLQREFIHKQVVVSGKQSVAAYVVGDLAQDSVGDRHTVLGRGSTTELIHHD